MDRDKLGVVEIKEIIATDNEGYTVTYLYNEKGDCFKYKQSYDKNSIRIGDAEIVGIEILTYESKILSLDLVVDKDNNRTTIKSSLEEIEVKEFIPVLCTYVGS